MASVDGNNSAAIDHRPSRSWKSLAASRWSPLDLQKFHAVKVPDLIVSLLQQTFCSVLETSFLISYLGSPVQVCKDWGLLRQSIWRRADRETYSRQPVLLACAVGRPRSGGFFGWEPDQ
jgi:hypothetical protein